MMIVIKDEEATETETPSKNAQNFNDNVTDNTKEAMKIKVAM